MDILGTAAGELEWVRILTLPITALICVVISTTLHYADKHYSSNRSQNDRAWGNVRKITYQPAKYDPKVHRFIVPSSKLGPRATPRPCRGHYQYEAPISTPQPEHIPPRASGF